MVTSLLASLIFTTSDKESHVQKSLYNRNNRNLAVVHDQTSRGVEMNQFIRAQFTQQFCVADGFVTFTKHFKYLGSCISYDLKDDYDVKMRVSAAYRAMGALHSFWRSNEVELYSKYLIFMAIPLNLVLWGCESWALKESLIQQIDVFIHRSIRRILNINILDVKEHRIKNTDIRQRFYNIPSAHRLITVRQLKFIGKVFRNSSTQLPTQLLTCWCDNKQKRGRALYHNRKSIVASLQLVLPDVEVHGSISSWGIHALDDKHWNNIISQYKLRKDDTDSVPPSPPPPPSSPPRSSTSPPSHNAAPPSPTSPPRFASSADGDIRLKSLSVLGLSYEVTERELKQKYRSLARIYHPDKNQSTITGLTKEEATALFQTINNSYSFLLSIL